MAVALADTRRKPLVGSPKPRMAPPLPARSHVKEYEAQAAEIGITLYPWQKTAGRYLNAVDADDRWLYHEFACVVGRQNGKSELLVPLIVQRLRAGRNILHTAQNAKLPKKIHERVALIFQKHYPDLLPAKRGISYQIGHEWIQLKDGGGRYQIVPPTEHAARGESADDLLVDELLAMNDHDFMAAGEATLSASDNPQVIYLSNAGSEDSVVLNSVRSRRDQDPSLAYLEWSADPDYAVDDVRGWVQANPAIGHQTGKLDYLQRKYQSRLLDGTLHIFETEHLCRWVVALQRRFVDAESWAAQQLLSKLGRPIRPGMAVSMDPTGERASAAVAWRNPDESVSLWVIADVTGSPIDVDQFGPELRDLAAKQAVSQTAYDPWTDVDLARFLARARAVNGREYANASVTFARLVDERKLRMDGETHAIIDRDLARLTRRSTTSGSFMAIRSNDQEPATAALAAIRAVYLVATPVSGLARIH